MQWTSLGNQGKCHTNAAVPLGEDVVAAINHVLDATGSVSAPHDVAVPGSDVSDVSDGVDDVQWDVAVAFEQATFQEK